MLKEKINVYDAIVIGSGAAGFNFANRIMESGVKSVALITEGLDLGTSRNTGSDKQTYYKLSIGGSALDSVNSLAENLFAPGSVDGDTALVEAALSTRCFYNLVELGVAFPHNRYGEYVGYKTDHDPFERATSSGPLTSKFMTEALQKKAKALNVKIYDNLYAVEILKHNNEVCGLICLDKKTSDFVLFSSPNVVLATGGPAGIYYDSVYPTCHTGSSSLALFAGAKFQNVTEWQYGLASLKPRWNVSGTYMQVLPRFVSIDSEGKEHEFLADYFEDVYEALSMVFLKGYQWPFDSNKVLKGSSVIDLLVYNETVNLKRRVYLDYTKNPFNIDNISFPRLAEAARTYLTKAGVNENTPFGRLKHMNEPAIELYKGKGVDLSKDYLEIALCAQHHNGGIAVDKWWQTNITGLFACGECAGTHGVSRPGGSALNSGQVGSLRASQFVLANKRILLDNATFEDIASKALVDHYHFKANMLLQKDNVRQLIVDAQKLMSANGAAIRDLEKMKEALKVIKGKINNLVFGVQGPQSVYLGYKYRDILYTQLLVLMSFVDFSLTAGISRGSAIYYNKNGQLREGLNEMFRFIPDDGSFKNKVQEANLVNENTIHTEWRLVRPLPKEENFFENVWKEYRINKNIY